jgi:hypothetical protein
MSKNLKPYIILHSDTESDIDHAMMAIAQDIVQDCVELEAERVVQPQLDAPMAEFIEQVDRFVEQVLPQAGKLVLDIGNLNDMCMNLDKYKIMAKNGEY